VFEDEDFDEDAEEDSDVLADWDEMAAASQFVATGFDAGFGEMVDMPFIPDNREEDFRRMRDPQFHESLRVDVFEDTETLSDPGQVFDTDY